MNPENFKQIWNLILANEGNVFQTIGGAEFTYLVNENVIQIVGNRPYNLSIQNFLNALPHFNPDNLGALPQRIVGRSYVWGIYNSLADQIEEI